MTQAVMMINVLPLHSVCLHGIGLKVTALSTAQHLEGEKREQPLN